MKNCLASSIFSQGFTFIVSQALFVFSGIFCRAKFKPSIINVTTLAPHNQFGHPRALGALDSQTAARFTRRCQRRYSF